jgi:hypothetical protein
MMSMRGKDGNGRVWTTSKLEKSRLIPWLVLKEYFIIKNSQTNDIHQ